MKNFLAKVGLTVFLCPVVTACYDDDSLVKTNVENGVLREDLATGPIPTPSWAWTHVGVPDLDPVDQQEYYANDIVTLNDDVYVRIGWGDEDIIHKLDQSRMRWERVSNLSLIAKPFEFPSTYLFSKGSKLYYLDKSDDQDNLFYSIDPFTRVKTKLRSFPGTVNYDYTCFVIGSKGYVTGGYHGNPLHVTSSVYSDQIWEYDFVSNTWTNKGQLPGGPRASASAFVIGNYVYLGFGIDSPYGSGTHYRKDWVKFTPGAQAYIRLADFPTTGPWSARHNADGFVLNGKIYVGWGRAVEEFPRATDFWEYDPGDNGWTRKADCPGVTGSSGLSAFSVGNAGYNVVGNLKSFSRYSNTPLIVPAN